MFALPYNRGRGRGASSSSNVTKINLDPMRKENMSLAFNYLETQNNVKMRDMAVAQTEVDITILTMMSYEEMQRISVCVVNALDNTNKIQTIMDARMSPNEDVKICATCHRDRISCPGHYGLISFNIPIYHPLGLKHVVYVLQSVCNKCSNLLLTDLEYKQLSLERYEGIDRLRHVASASATMKHGCRYKSETEPRCSSNPQFLMNSVISKGAIIGSYTLEKGKKSQKAEVTFNINDVYNILNSIRDVDVLRKLGFSGDAHPRNLIMRGLLVIPPIARPSATINDRICPDELDTMYNRIIRTNNALTSYTYGTITESRSNVKMYDDLVFNVKHLMDNSDGKYGRGQRRKVEGLKERLQKSKEGLISGVIRRKRGNYSARTVVVGNPSLRFGQVSVPRLFASFLTEDVIITAENIAEMTRMLREGLVTTVIPGSGRTRGMRIAISAERKEKFIINVGDTVKRHFRDGDIVLLNRAPTMHKEGIMGFEGILWDNLTVGVNLAITPSMGMDFDGDEVNLYKPQSEAAKQEAKNMLAAPRCVMSGQSNRPMIAPVFDALTGAYMLTGDSTWLTYDEFYLLLSVLDAAHMGDKISTLEQRLEENGVYPRLFDEDISIADMESYNARLKTLMRNKSKLEKDIAKSVTDVTDIKAQVQKITTQETFYRTRLQGFVLNKVNVAKMESDIDKAKKLTEELTLKYVDSKEDMTDTIKAEVEKETHVYSRYRRHIKRISGRAAFSSLLPVDLYYEGPDNVLIRNGILITGTISKKHIGMAPNSLIQYLWKYYDIDTTSDFITYSVWMMDQFLKMHGFSIGITDCIPTDPEYKKKIDDEVIKAKLQIEAIDVVTTDAIEEARRENKITGILNNVMSVVDRLGQESLESDNPLAIMFGSGAKGSARNISQIAGMVGPQMRNDLRMPLALANGTRCTPYSLPGEATPETRGLCLNSFLTGLVPREYFHHQAAGREGLVDQAVKTSQAGNLSNKLSRTLENILITTNNLATLPNGSVIQFMYGNDSFDARELHRMDTNVGTVNTFININHVVGRLNAKYGF